MNLKKLLLFVAGLTLMFVFFPFHIFTSNNPIADQSKGKTPNEASAPSTVKIAAFGDVMMHSPQIKAGQLGAEQYDFRKFFKEVKPYISAADIAIGNFEMTLAGSSFPYSGYPQFNAPDQITDALKDAGVDVVSTANNHANDTGEKGILRTHKVINESGIIPTGTAPSQEERKPAIVEKNGIKVAFLAYTEHTNGLPVPKDKPYLVNRIDVELIKQDIQKAREQGAEYVLVSLHWGVEYTRQPNDFEKKTAQAVLQAGADAILGSHPHVLQPMEKINVNGQEKFIIYSMGNFISNQSDPYTDEGIIVYLDIQKDPTSKQVQLKGVSYLPTFVHKYQGKGKTQYVVIPETQKEMESSLTYPGLNPNKWKSVWNHTVTHMTSREAFPTFQPIN